MRKITYSEECVGVFLSEIAKFPDSETGGVLLGYLEEGVVYVEKASEAGPKAIHEDIYFQADPNYVDLFIDMQYANSNGRYRYLGEWHTHPQVVPEPSPKDLNSLDEISGTADEFVILLIIGAINFKAETFNEQSISILKLVEDSKFYLLLPVNEK